ncbi:MAG: DUF5615 family PIN-like protein [Gammaproteobacteria bacterium]
MPPTKVAIRFFTDQNVANSVGDALVEAGHGLTRLRDVMEGTTPDPIIAVACVLGEHVLVSHDKDFRQISKRLNVTRRQYRNMLHRIQLCCPEPKAALRVREALSLIEAEWHLASASRPMIIDLHEHSIRTYR